MKRRIVGRGTAVFLIACIGSHAMAQSGPQPPASPPGTSTTQLARPDVALAVARVSYASGGYVDTTCMEGTFEMIAVQPGETLQIVVQYPTDEALQIVDLTALDGGMLLPPTAAVDEATPSPTPFATPTPIPFATPDTSPVPPACIDCNAILVDPPALPGAGLSLVVAVDGTVTFSFVVGLEPGLRQISLRVAGEEIGIPIWVNDPNDPDANPPALLPEPKPPQPQ